MAVRDAVYAVAKMHGGLPHGDFSGGPDMPDVLWGADIEFPNVGMIYEFVKKLNGTYGCLFRVQLRDPVDALSTSAVATVTLSV